MLMPELMPKATVPSRLSSWVATATALTPPARLTIMVSTKLAPWFRICCRARGRAMFAIF